MSVATTHTAAPSVSQRQPYPAYKDSGVQWLGNVPSHWRLKRLKYAASMSATKLTEKPSDLPYLGLENVEAGTGRLLIDIPTENVESVVNRFVEGDVLFGKLRPYLAKVVRATFDGVCTTEMLALHPGRDIDGKYLFYRLLSEDFINLVNSFTYGVKMPRVSSEQIGDVYIALPSLAEQRAIAAFLDRETAKTDALIAKKERQIALLREKRTALVDRSVSHGLDDTIPLYDSGVEFLGAIPDHWQVKRLKFISPELTVGIVVTPAKYYVDDGVPCLRSLNVREGQIADSDLVFISPESNALLRKSMVFTGDIVSVRTGQPGTTAAIDQRFNGANCIDLIIVRQSPRFVSPFMVYVANSRIAKAQYGAGSDGAIQQHFNIETAKNLLAPFPPLEEQQSIVSYLDRETAKIDALVTKVQEHIDKLREHRAALISAAVTGKIDVREGAV